MKTSRRQVGELLGRAAVLLIASCSSAIAQGSGESGRVVTPMRPAYHGLDRSEENWSILREPAARTDRWDSLKFIAIGPNDEWYVTVGGEARSFYEYYRNYNWGAGVQDKNGFLLHRFIGSADVHLGARTRVFVEMKSGLVSGRTGGPRPGRDQDHLDVGQFFVELSTGSRGKPHLLSIKVGRQQLQYGEGSLLDVRDLNVRRSFDGAKLIMRSAAWRTDVFVVRPAKSEPGSFDDVSDRSQTLLGVYAVGVTRQWRVVRRLDLYYLVLDRRRAQFVQGVGAERRHTLGTVVHGRQGNLAFFVEGTLQMGTFGSGHLLAWKYAQSLSYTIGIAGVRPTISLLGAISSGDKEPNDPNLQTFYPLFPKGVYYGYTDGSGSLNAIVVHPKVAVPLSRAVSLGWDSYVFFRQRTTDGLYSQSGGLLRAGGESLSHNVGALHDVTLTWLIGDHAAVQSIAAYYDAGTFLRETNPQGKDLTYFGTKVSYIF